MARRKFAVQALRCSEPAVIVLAHTSDEAAVRGANKLGYRWGREPCMYAEPWSRGRVFDVHAGPDLVHVCSVCVTPLVHHYRAGELEPGRRRLNRRGARELGRVLERERRSKSDGT